MLTHRHHDVVISALSWSAHCKWITAKCWFSVHITANRLNVGGLCLLASLTKSEAKICFAFCGNTYIIHLSTHRGNRGLWLGDGNMLRDSARSYGVQTAILHSRRGLGGLGFLLPDPWRLFFSWEAMLAAAWLALFHAGRAGGYSDLGATHCTLNRGEWSLWLEDKGQQEAGQ